MAKLLEIFQDDNGSYSMMRVIVLIVVAGIIAKNLYVTIHSGNDVTLDFKEVMAVVAALGAKAAQKAFEKPAPTTPWVS